MTHDSPRRLPFVLDAMVFVCKACGKRGSGPREPKPKEVARELKLAGKQARLKTRVVLTGCMGLCPKRATAVAVASGSDGAPVQYAIESLSQAAAALQPKSPRLVDAGT